MAATRRCCPRKFYSWRANWHCGTLKLLKNVKPHFGDLIKGPCLSLLKHWRINKPFITASKVNQNFYYAQVLNTVWKIVMLPTLILHKNLILFLILKFYWSFTPKFLPLETILTDIKKIGSGRAQTPACLSGNKRRARQVSYKFRGHIQGHCQITLPTP